MNAPSIPRTNSRDQCQKKPKAGNISLPWDSFSRLARLSSSGGISPLNDKPKRSNAPVRLIVRRVKPTPGSQLALFAKYSYHGFITDRDGETMGLETDYRRHAEIENAIRDLKYGVGLNHMPSGCFAANGALLAVQVTDLVPSRCTNGEYGTLLFEEQFPVAGAVP